MTTWNKMYLKLQQKTTRGSQRTPSLDPSSILTQKIRQKAEVCFVFKLKNSIRIGSSCHRSVQVGTSVPWLVNISIFRHLNIRKLFYFLLYQDWISAIQSGGFQNVFLFWSLTSTCSLSPQHSRSFRSGCWWDLQSEREPGCDPETPT